MSWTFTLVFSVAASGREAKSLVCLDGRIWALTNENNPVSGNYQSGRIYYSSDGDNWTEDAAWEGPARVGSGYFGGQLFVHQGILHLLCNNTLDDGRIYRRIDGAWELLHAETIGSNLRYHTACSNDAWIIVCGYEHDGPPVWGEAVIWRWDGSSMVQEFHADHTSYPYDDAAYRAIYYINGEWYAQTTRWLDESTHVKPLHYRGDGSWPIFHIYTGAFGNLAHLLASRFGLLMGDDLWPPSGIWENINFPGLVGVSCQYGSTITARVGSNYYGNCYIYTGEEWVWKGRPAPGYDTPLYDFQHFTGQLYAAGALGIGPRIWRITMDHQTSLAPWAKPTARTLVCDHQYGDTLYLGVYKDTGRPLMMVLDEEFEWWEKVYEPSAGSFIGVQTAGVRDVGYGFGYFGPDDQIRITEDWGATTSDADDDWGTDKVTSLEYHTTSGSDLITTLHGGQDLLQTLTAREPWSKIADIPVRPRCQLRVQNDVWIGSDEADAAPVRLYSGGSWAEKSNGLPTVAINDLEIGF